MKIGIVTLVSDNYGNKYQNYAVEQLLSEYGQTVTFRVAELEKPVVERNKKSKLKKLNPRYVLKVLQSRAMYQYDMTATDESPIKTWMYICGHRKELKKLKFIRHLKFQEFEKEHLHIAEREINFQNCYEEKWLRQYDYFICGSDQIWNPTYLTTSKLVFLEFAKGKSIALAPSFGVASIPEEAEGFYRKNIAAIDHLSVREKSGAKLIKNLTGRESEVLADPTIAIAAETWKKLAVKPKIELPSRYVVCYFLGKINKKYRMQIEQFAKEKKLEIVKLFDIKKPEYYIFDPKEVLYTILHADYILTDSFHGTVFSILFEKQFYVFQRNEEGMSMSSRLETLLDKMELTNRYYGECSEDITDECWENVRKKIKKETREIKKYLKKSLISTENSRPMLANQKVCTGCTACAIICPKGCIKMKENIEGFLYPEIDRNQCVECRQCEKVCPLITSLERADEEQTEAVAAFSKDENVRMNSSSGGVFSEFAEKILEKNGVVYGAAYDEKYDVKHIRIENIQDMVQIRGAKYSQSMLGNTFSKVKEDLMQGKQVLFSGTPCQIAGLKSFLQKDYSNLLCIDFVCHGIPSPLIWRKYVEYRRKKDGSVTFPKKINLRSKESGWSKWGYSTEFEYSDIKKYQVKWDNDPFMKLFVKDYVLRNSCYRCSFKGVERVSDLTIGDFWGIWDLYPEMDDDKGTSLILIHSDRGKRLYQNISNKLVVKKVTLQECMMQNKSLVESAVDVKSKIEINENIENIFEIK